MTFECPYCYHEMNWLKTEETDNIRSRIETQCSWCAHEINYPYGETPEETLFVKIDDHDLRLSHWTQAAIEKDD